MIMSGVSNIQTLITVIFLINKDDIIRFFFEKVLKMRKNNVI